MGLLWPGGGSNLTPGEEEVVSTIKIGFKEGFNLRYLSGTVVRIEPGQIEGNSKLYTSVINIDHAITSFVPVLTEFDIIYIYIDDSASTPPTAVIIDSLTEPVPNAVKDGFYNGDDRCIGYVMNGIFFAAFNKVSYFDTTVLSERRVRYVISRGDTPRLSLAQNPNSLWQVPNKFDPALLLPPVSSVVPVNAVEMSVHMEGADTGSLLKRVLVSACSQEFGLVNLTAFSAPLLGINPEFIVVQGWIPLGPSRNILIGGENDDNNVLSTFSTGYGIKI